MIGVLIAVNLFGTAYGFWWYHGQLRETPLIFWPVVPDSPGSTLLFALFLITLMRNVRKPLLAALAYMSSFKYGLWTPLVMGHMWLTTGEVTFESVHLSLSHLGMALEALLFARVHRPLRPFLPAALGWLLFNDFMDYALGLHPVLPVPEAAGTVGSLAVFLSFLSFLMFGLPARAKE